MREYLAIPGWKTPPTTVEAWADRLTEAAGVPVAVDRESPSVAWLESGPLRLKGYVVIEDGHATAINFELNDPDPGPATLAIEAAAAALGWEIHADDDEDDEDDEDDD